MMLCVCVFGFLGFVEGCSQKVVVFACSQEYAEVAAEGRKHVLLDVRKEVQFAVCALDKAINIPLSRLEVTAQPLQ